MCYLPFFADGTEGTAWLGARSVFPLNAGVSMFGKHFLTSTVSSFEVTLHSLDFTKHLQFRVDSASNATKVRYTVGLGDT